MAKQSPNPWLIIFILLLPVLVPLLWVSGSLIVLTIKFMISYGDFTMSKAVKTNLPTSPTGVPAQTDPYEYNWQLDVDDTLLAYHRGGEKKSVGLGILYVESRNSSHLYSDFYDSKGNLARKLMGAGGTHFTSPERWQLPAEMYITYYSELENQFYQLETDLPREAFKKAFDETFLDYLPVGWRKEDPTFSNAIELYVGPEGRVLVFVKNANNTSKRIVGRYQAKKIEGDYVLDVMDDGNRRYALDENGNYNKEFTREYFFNTDFERVKKDAPPYYEMFKVGKGMPIGSGKWIDDIQIKYPWRLEVIDPTGDWLGEHAVNYISREWDTVLRDRLPEQMHALKPVPSNIKTWVYDKPTGQRYFLEIDTYARIKDNGTRNGLYTIYKDPNVDYLRKRFEYFFPNRTLADNDKPVKPEDFAVLKIILDNSGKMSEIYLEKNGVKLPLDGAYHYYLAPVQEDGYLPQEGFDEYITEPKVDLIDPELSSINQP